ncbi:MAG: chromosomal replication initiator protein DnaA [Christensenellaceae bacterium]
MSAFNILWEKTLNYLEEDLPMFQFNVWIKELKPIQQENETYFFEVSSPMHKNLMNEKYSDKIISIMQLVYEEIYGVKDAKITLEFLTPQEASNRIVNEIKPEKTNKPVSSSLNPNYTFETFVVGESNKFANAAAIAVAQSPGHSYNPLFLYGGVGLGKTHLMHAVGNYVLKNNPEAEVVYVTSETFMNELIRMIQLTNNNANIDIREKFRDKYRKVDVLLIDDIQFIAGKDVTQDEFFHTFNALHELNKQIIISSDRPPKEMEKLEERMRSRFEWGLVADIKMPDYETRVAILLKKAQMLKEQNTDILPIKDEVLHYIAQAPNSNIRTLEGALQRIIMYSELNKDELNSKEIDLSIASKALEDFFSAPAVKNITPKLVIDVVCNYFDIKEEDIRGKKKNRELAFPRQISMYILRDLTDLSYLKIAEFFGKKDHTTVIYAEDKIKKQLKEDAELKKVVEDIIAKIKV